MLPQIIANSSKYFSLEGCKFGNERYKKNCARLGVFRDFNLPCSYTIESSCWGYTDPTSDATFQFKELDFINFGKHLAVSVAKFFNIKVTEKDKHENFGGLDILIDFGLYEDDSETKLKVKQYKKTGKVIGGKLIKMI